MKFQNKNHSGYALITSILLVGFLIVLTLGTLNLALQEMQDGKGRQNYLQALYAAEAGQELGLLQIKKYGYGYDNDGVNPYSQVLSVGTKISDFEFDFTSAQKSYSGSIGPGESKIFPLFWIDPAGITHSLDSDFSLQDSSSSLVWNMIGQQSGTSGIGSMNQDTSSEVKSIQSGAMGEYNFSYSDMSLGDFLQTNTGSYLVVLNPSESSITYQFTSNDFFTIPVAQITSTAKVGKYKQNFRTLVDNTEFLGILRYSIFSQ